MYIYQHMYIYGDVMTWQVRGFAVEFVMMGRFGCRVCLGVTGSDSGVCGVGWCGGEGLGQYVYADVNTSIYRYICVCIYIYIYIYICVYINIHTYMHMYIYIHIYIYMYIYINMIICIKII